MVAAVASDIMILSDGQSTEIDKTMAGVNLAGIGLAATGTSVGEVALDVLGLETTALPIPVVGEVLVAGTALYFGAEWTVQHWDQIEQWESDVGHGLVAGYHALEHADQWVNNQIDSGVNWAGHALASGAATAGHDVESGLDSAGHFLSRLL